MAIQKDSYYDTLLVEVEDHLSRCGGLERAVVRRGDSPEAEVRDNRAEWTNALLNALAEVGRNRGFVPAPNRLYLSRDRRGQAHNSRYDRPRGAEDDRGEFMTDMTWWSKGAYDDEWWDPTARSTSIDLCCELVVESEWGPRVNRGFATHMEEVAYDFCKLLVSRARRRLMLASYLSGTEPVNKNETLDAGN